MNDWPTTTDTVDLIAESELLQERSKELLAALRDTCERSRLLIEATKRLHTRFHPPAFG